MGNRLLLVVAAVLFSGPLCAQERGNVADGQILAREVCAECHAVDEGFMISPNPEAPSFTEIADKPGMTELALSVWFQSPHPTMPNFILEEKESRDLIAYIRSLRKY
ncbi:MAG: cytochrome c [Rhizobiaceae bacterium]